MVAKETIQTAITSYFAANNALDANAVAELFAPDARMERVPGIPPVEGQETIRKAYRQLFNVFSRSDVTAVNTFIFGNGAAVLYHGEFTAKKDRQLRWRELMSSRSTRRGRSKRSASTGILPRFMPYSKPEDRII